MKFDKKMCNIAFSADYTILYYSEYYQSQQFENKCIECYRCNHPFIYYLYEVHILSCRKPKT